MQWSMKMKHHFFKASCTCAVLNRLAERHKTGIIKLQFHLRYSDAVFKQLKDSGQRTPMFISKRNKTVKCMHWNCNERVSHPFINIFSA